MLETQVFLLTVTVVLIAATHSASALLRIYNSTAEVSSNDLVPRGSTVVLVCTETPTPQQVDYQWTCTNPPCDGQYRKVDGNVLVVVATTATRGLYRCRPNATMAEDENNVNISVQTILPANQLAIYNNGTLLLQSMLFTSPEQIPNGLNCTTGKSNGVPSFKRENGSTAYHDLRAAGQYVIVPPSSLQPNGQHKCLLGNKQIKFYSYFNKPTLMAPQVSHKSRTTKNKLILLLTTPRLHNSGRFIVRYNCAVGGTELAVQYRSYDPGVESNITVTRSRSCFVVGEISRVTVWFVNGENISTPAVFTLTSLAVTDAGLKTEATISASKTQITIYQTITTMNCAAFPTSTCPGTSVSQPESVTTARAIIIGATTANLLILLLSITLLVISGVLIVKSRKRHTSTLYSTPQVTFDKGSKEPAVQIYDEVNIMPEGIATMKLRHEYQGLDIVNMDASNQYSTTH